MYLLDTNVVSELRKNSKKRTSLARMNPNVQRWFESVSRWDLYLSVVTVLELEIGCLQIERRDSVQGRVLRSWLENHALPPFAGRILTVDIPVVLRCAALHVPNPCADRDALIAATALVHGMTVVTRNTADFASAGVQILNPWEH
jgi:hypothetical protein